MNLLQRGLANSFRGVRTGDVELIALGAAMLFIVYLRASKPTRSRVYKKKLRPGQEVTIRLVKPTAAAD